MNYFVDTKTPALKNVLRELLGKNGWDIRFIQGGQRYIRLHRTCKMDTGQSHGNYYYPSQVFPGEWISIEEAVRFIEGGSINKRREYVYSTNGKDVTYYGFDRKVEGADFIALTAIGCVWAVDDKSCGDLHKYLVVDKVVGVYSKVNT